MCPAFNQFDNTAELSKAQAPYNERDKLTEMSATGRMPMSEDY